MRQELALSEAGDEAEGALKRATFDDFFRQQFPAVFGAAALLVQNPATAEEIAQESFARLYARWSTVASIEHARRFVFKVALNLSRSELRRRARAPLSFDEASVGRHMVRTEDENRRVENQLILNRELSQLSWRQRSCLVLVDYIGLDSRSAGRLLLIRPSTVRVHLARARAALRKALAQPPGEE